MSDTKAATPTKKLSEADLHFTEHRQPFHTVTAPVGTTREDVLKPEFWNHVAKRIGPMAEIRIMPKDGAWYGVYLVTYADKIRVRVHELSFHNLDAATPEDLEDSDRYIKWSGPVAKFRVIRKSDDVVLKEGLGSKVEAMKWMVADSKAA